MQTRGIRTYVCVTALLAVLVVVPLLAAAAPSRAPYPSAGEFFAFLGEGDNFAVFNDFVAFLRERGVADVVPPEQLVRQGTDWKQVGEPAFAMPPRELWPNIVPTLELMRDEVIPMVGEVEVVSAYRTPRYNRLAGGEEGSKHLKFSAVDIMPKREIPRSRLHANLIKAWGELGPERNWGLGLYSRVRVHVDTWRFRRW